MYCSKRFMSLFVALTVVTLIAESSGRSTRQTRARGIITPVKSSERVNCKDESGKSVPWFVAYKLPKLKNAENPNLKAGLGYSYILPGFTQWKQSEKSIGSLDSIVGQTIGPYIQNPNDHAFVVYNDQPPYRDDYSNNGHAKGIVLTKPGGGFWLVHSVPKFPINGENFYPTNGVVNAQMFLCMTLPARDIDNIGHIFKMTRPHVNNVSLPSSFVKNFPSMKSFLDIKRYSRKSPTSNVFNLKVGELNIQIFAKSPKFGKEIYSEWLAPTLKSSLEVQSWLNGINAFTSNCSSHEYSVHNIVEKKIDGEEFARADHSKWAVGTEIKDPWTCVSDLNRMEGQKSRGGAALCASNSKLWEAFNSAVIDLQPCPNPNIRNGN